MECASLSSTSLDSSSHWQTFNDQPSRNLGRIASIYPSLHCSPLGLPSLLLASLHSPPRCSGPAHVSIEPENDATNV